MKPKKHLRNQQPKPKELNMETNWTNIAEELNYSVKNYEGLTKQIVQIKNRAQAYGIDPDHKNSSTASTTRLER